MANSDTLKSYYNQILSGMQTPTVNYQMPTIDQLSAQIASYLRPQVDQAIVNRQQQTLQNKALIDADAASRGMGRSTYVTDVKNRAQNAEASDIANLESNYAAAKAEALLNQYNQFISNKLQVDMANAQLAADYEQRAYNRAGDAYSLNKSSGGKSRLTEQDKFKAELEALVNQGKMTPNTAAKTYYMTYPTETGIMTPDEYGYDSGVLTKSQFNSSAMAGYMTYQDYLKAHS